MSYGLTIDPGMSNGACLFWFDDTTPIKIIRQWQFKGGAGGLASFLRLKNAQVFDGSVEFDGIRIDHLIVEKFTPRPHESFSLTLDSVEPLRGEGVLIGLGLESFIEWREPSQQYFMGGEDLKDKKKRSREFLKLHGMYLTGKAVGQPDADDAISATLHAVAWLRKKRHMPTLSTLFEGA